jgi:hypothetical protein
MHVLPRKLARHVDVTRRKSDLSNKYTVPDDEPTAKTSAEAAAAAAVTVSWWMSGKSVKLYDCKICMEV